MMKKNYKKLEMEVIEFDTEDVITESGTDTIINDGDDDDLSD